MDNKTLGMILALGGGGNGGGGGGGLIPVPTAQDAGKMLIVGVVQGEAGYQLVAFDEPMKFKGTLGTGGTITTLPAASSANNGYTYAVITDGTYAGQEADAGDQFISNGEVWWRIPSGDEASVIDDSVTSTALTWSSKKINDECKIKSFNYTGNGETTNTINFPSDWRLLLAIEGMGSGGNDVTILNNIVNGFTPFVILSYFKAGTLGLTGNNVFEISNMTNTTLTYTASNAGLALNENGSTYKVYYI